MSVGKNSTSGEYLAGVKYWAQWKPIGQLPQFDLFRYVGFQPDIGLYFFQGVSNPMRILRKSLNQLGAQGFKPFCIDTKEYYMHLSKAGLIPPIQTPPPPPSGPGIA